MALLERHDTNSIAHLKMNAPEKLNALSEEMLSALQSQFDSLQNDRQIRAVILSGSGKAFCAGHDLKEMTAGRQAEDGGKAYFTELFQKCARMMTSIQKRSGKTWAEVEATASYAIYVHDGTQYMSPRPFLTEGGKRALRRSDRRIQEALAKAGLV